MCAMVRKRVTQWPDVWASEHHVGRGKVVGTNGTVLSVPLAPKSWPLTLTTAAVGTRRLVWTLLL